VNGCCLRGDPNDAHHGLPRPLPAGSSARYNVERATPTICAISATVLSLAAGDGELGSTAALASVSAGGGQAAVVRSRMISRSNQPARRRYGTPLARRGRGVDALGQRPEPDTPLGERVHRLGRMPHRATEPVEPPHHQDITGPQVVEQRIQLWPAVQGPGGGVNKEAGAPGRF
jgi:hypothetical protein